MKCPFYVPESNPKDTGPAAEPLLRPADSIMSLSTASEESAMEDEKFVKIKPCEMESGSSKASSQSGKENLELEEQIQHLNEQLEALKQNLKGKDEECKSIKLQLEDILLEKNVEARSISTLSLELKSMRQSHDAKEEQMDEVTLVLDDLLDQFQPFFPHLLETSSDSDSLEIKLSLLKGLPKYFQTLERVGIEKDIELTDVRTQLQELQEQQNDIIGGYQLVTQNYEKLQAEFDEYKLGVSAEASESNQLKEEFERFREELISKDEDLMELQSRCDELQENLSTKIEECELVRNQLQELGNMVVITKLDKSIETEAVPEVSRETSSPTNSSSTTQGEVSPKIKKLKEQCLESLRLAKVEQQRIQKELRVSIAQNTDLSHRLLAQQDQIREKDEAMNQLVSAVQEYQTSIERKTLEINETVTAKNLEIEHLMATYKSYADGKERKEHELNFLIEEKDKIIQSLRMEQDILNQGEQTQIRNLREELQNVKTTFSVMEETYLGKIRNLEVSETRLEASVAQVAQLLNHIKEQEVRIEALIQQSLDASATLSQVVDLTSRLELKDREVSHLRGELSRLASVVQSTKEIAREEYENKLKEEEMLRESEILSLQQQITSLLDELNRANASWNMASELVSKTRAENESLQTEISGTKVEKESVQLEWNLVMDEVKRKDEMIFKLEASSQALHQQVEELTNSLVEQEARAARAEASLESHVQKSSIISSSQSIEVEKNGERLQQLEEEVRALNEACKRKDRKVELLQSKIQEIESSEMKAFEETFMLKNWVKQLEMENGRYQEEVYLLTNSNSSNDSSENRKIKKIQDEMLRLIYAIDERDNRCIQLTVEITRVRMSALINYV